MAEWDQSNPTDSSLISQYPQNERDARDAVRANFTINHHAADDDDVGKHEVIELLANATPIGVAGQGNFYTKDVDSGEIELFYQDEDGNETQLTERGAITNFPNVTGSVTANQTDLNRTSEHLSVGDLKMWPFSSLKAGHLWANGETIGDDGSGADHESSEYEALFDLLVADAPAWGNAGTEVFADGDTVSLPDMRDRSPLGTATIGTDDAGRVDNTSTGLGDTGGEDEHQLTGNEMPSHNHGGNTGSDGAHNHGITQSDTDADPAVFPDSALRAGETSGPANTDTNTNTINSQGNHNHNISTSGGDSAHNNMHPFAAVNFIIAYR